MSQENLRCGVVTSFFRGLALPRSVQHWSLTTLREKLVKIGAKVVTHGRYVTFQMAEGGHPTTAVKDYPSPHLTARAADASTDMIKTMSAGMETARNSIERFARIRTNGVAGQL